MKTKKRMAPQRLAAKADVLYPSVPDPHGGDDAVYERCALRLLDAMKRAGIISD